MMKKYIQGFMGVLTTQTSLTISSSKLQYMLHVSFTEKKIP